MVGRKFSLIPRQSRRRIHDYLFQEGVIVVQKSATLKEHPELKEIPNLHVMMALRSLKSKMYVKEIFNWQHHYYELTNEGIEYLRDLLQVPPHVHPAILTRKVRPAAPRAENDQRRPAGRGMRRNFDRDQGGYARG